MTIISLGKLLIPSYNLNLCGVVKLLLDALLSFFLTQEKTEKKTYQRYEGQLIIRTYKAPQTAEHPEYYSAPYIH